MVRYSIIAAISDKLVIGKNNSMPWHVPEDLKLFKRLTTGNIIIMGRKTFESIGKALPGRTTLVVSRSPGEFNSRYESDRLSACASLNDALTEAQTLSAGSETPRKIFVAGGASIYEQALEGAERLFLSRIPGEYEGDTFFPRFDGGKWGLESSENYDGFRLEIYLQK